MSQFKAFPYAIGVALVLGWSGASAVAQPLSLAPTASRPASLFEQAMPSRAPYEATEEEQGAAETPAQFRRQIVSYSGREPAGTIIVDTPNTYLYYVLGNGRAVRYGIGVGREGFTWSGTKAVAEKKEWPDWVPPAEMIERQPYLPRFMAGGPGNPLGARALYLGNTVYRIHGTNQPQTIGSAVSSGCFRLVNNDVVDLYERVPVGTKVVVRQRPEI
jgi:lipoprotein-anchoring transpeptidase ErfK/SrfK